MLVPSPLLVGHVIGLVKSVADPRFLVGVAIVVAAIVGIVRLRRTRPDLAVCRMRGDLAAAPGSLPAGARPGSVRGALRAISGVAGFSWFCVAGADALIRSGRIVAPRWALPSLLAAIVLAAGARTGRARDRMARQRDLGLASMRDEPRAPIGYLLAGSFNLREGRKDEALRIFREGLSTSPKAWSCSRTRSGWVSSSAA